MSPFNKEGNLSSHLRSLGQCVVTPADASETDGLKSTGKNEKIRVACWPIEPPINVATLNTQAGVGAGATWRQATVGR